MIKIKESELHFSYVRSSGPGGQHVNKVSTAVQLKYNVMQSDIPEELKQSRLAEVIVVQAKSSHESNKKDLGKTFEVLVEGTSKKSEDMLQGRNPQNKVVVFPKENYKKGDYVNVLVNDCTSATLLGTAVK